MEAKKLNPVFDDLINPATILNNSNAISAAGGYDVNNSLRFRQSASARLSRTPGTAGNRKTWTFSAWIKISTLTPGGVQQGLFSARSTSTDQMTIFYQNEKIYFQSGGSKGDINTNAVLRDVSAWYHLVVVLDATNATTADKAIIYLNGTRQSVTTTTSFTNADHGINATIAHNIGAEAFTNTLFFDGYMAEVNFIDGSAKTPSDFGATDATTGVWKPKAYTGTYGTNGFYLKFSDIATTSGSNAGLGKDFSGNTNYWTTNNISVTSGATYDAMKDVPTNTSATVANYCTGNPLDISVRASFANGNLTCTTLGGGSLNAGTARINTFNFTQHPIKWYWESTVTNAGGGRATFGMETTAFTAQPENWSGTAGWYLRADGVTNLTGATTFAAGDVMMFAYDGNTARFWIGKNGTWTNSGVPASGTNPNRTLTVGTEYWLLFNCNTGGTATAVCEMNFGQRPFAYTPPSGFVAVNTFNIPTSTIVKGNSVMDATLYTGNNTGQTITNAGAFRPDFLWIKVRSNTYDHTLADSVRGVSAFLASNTTAAEGTNSELTSFNSNGFTLGATGSMARNVSGQTYVAWQWQAGSSTVTNTSGSISSQVRANTTTGFSIVTYTGTGSNATVGHGLGVAPKMIIAKGRGNADNWPVGHASRGWDRHILLNSTAAEAVTGTSWNNTAPTSTVFTVGTDTRINQNTIGYVAYCWAEIAGFSKFGSYTGNGST